MIYIMNLVDKINQKHLRKDIPEFRVGDTVRVDVWVKDLRSYALDCILKGENIEGWKAVAGKSNRVLADQEKAFKVITDFGINKALLYERKPLTITELEKLLGKKEFENLVGDYIEKPKGAPTLAPMSDKRENYKLSNAKEDFAEREEK